MVRDSFVHSDYLENYSLFVFKRTDVAISNFNELIILR